jgi:photosystem II stability/assembly factor-like uncharacterized protein
MAAFKYPFKYPFKYSAVLALLLTIILMPLRLQAQNASGVPDVLDMPAMETRHAQQSLQLGISRAGKRLVSVGMRGIVLLSDDEGRNWRQARHVPVSTTLTDVEFVSAEQGWAVGHSGVLLFSGDGGENWELRLDGNQAAQIILEGAREYLASGAEGAERAVRNAEFLVDDGPDKPFLSVSFIDQYRGYLVGAYGLVLETRDGGKSWQSLVERIPNSRGNHLYQTLISGEQMLIVGEQGAVFRSEDSGENFEKLSVPYPGTFFGALGIDDDGLLVFGLQGNVWRSMDGGVSWHQVDVGEPITVTAGLRLRDGSLLLADESGRLLRSNNNGASFSELQMQSGTGATALSEAGNSGLVVASMRGVRRLENNMTEVGESQ